MCVVDPKTHSLGLLQILWRVLHRTWEKLKLKVNLSLRIKIYFQKERIFTPNVVT